MNDPQHFQHVPARPAYLHLRPRFATAARLGATMPSHLKQPFATPDEHATRRAAAVRQRVSQWPARADHGDGRTS